MNQITDMHCHILPGLDDGSESMDETLEALWEASRQGITAVIATPHYYPGRYEPDAGAVLKAWRQVKRRIQEEGIPIELYPGQECFYYSGLLEQLEEGEVLTLARSRYVLVEFDPECPYLQLLQGLTALQQGGYYPVLAHFERYQCLRDVERLRELKRHGIWLHMNFDTLLLRDGIFHRNPWRRLAAEGMADLFGSDCHGMHFRPYRVQEACAWMEKHLDAQILRRTMEHNIQKIQMSERQE